VESGVAGGVGVPVPCFGSPVPSAEELVAEVVAEFVASLVGGCSAFVFACCASSFSVNFAIIV
jgi:hypothetical protein